MKSEIRELMQSVVDGSVQLPAQSYRDSDYHEFELSTVYENGWMAIGYASEYDKPAKAQSIEVLGHPLLITRDTDNQLHILANVCRHRGHLLLQKDKSSGKLLTCPYHSWCYSLDGKFVKAPYWDGTLNSEPDEKQKADLGLIPIRFEIWYDIIFINLSGSAEAFEKFIAKIDARWSSSRPQSELRCFSRKSYAVPGNWKLAAENFLDNYHLPWVHPEIGSSVQASLGLEVEEIQLSDNILGFSHASAGDDKGKTEKPLPPWPGMSKIDQSRQDLFFMFPNTCLVMEGYYLWSMILLPGKADYCDEKLALYVIGDQAMDNDFENSRQQLADVIYKINDQDNSVIKNLQAGRFGNATNKGVYNQRHDQLGKCFHQMIANKALATS